MHHLSHIVLYFALGLVGGFALAYALFRKQAGSNTTNSNGSPSLSEPSSSSKQTSLALWNEISPLIVSFVSLIDKTIAFLTLSLPHS
tara:strand:- start:529 stop:789 length:261 start_codon:yes stop_codon:yes gene_type:complete